MFQGEEIQDFWSQKVNCKDTGVSVQIPTIYARGYLIYFFICFTSLYVVLRSIREFFTHMNTTSFKRTNAHFYL